MKEISQNALIFSVKKTIYTLHKGVRFLEFQEKTLDVKKRVIIAQGSVSRGNGGATKVYWINEKNQLAYTNVCQKGYGEYQSSVRPLNISLIGRNIDEIIKKHPYMKGQFVSISNELDWISSFDTNQEPLQLIPIDEKIKK